MLFQIVFVSAFVLFVADAQEYIKADIEPVCETDDTCSLKIRYQTRGHDAQFETTALKLIFTHTFGPELCGFYTSKPSDEIIYISICGKNDTNNKEVEGVIHSGGNIILINPTAESNGYDLHVLHPQYADRSLQDGDTEFKCWAPESGTSVNHTANDRSLSSAHKKGLRGPVIELLIVVDEFLVTYLTGGDRIAAGKFALQSVHGASAYLREVGIRLRIVGFQFLGKKESEQMYDHDGFDFDKWCTATFSEQMARSCRDSPEVLSLYAQRFREYKREHSLIASGTNAGTGPPDTTLLMTGIVDNGYSWGGLAWSGLGQPCDRDNFALAFPVNLQYHSYRDPRSMVLSTSRIAAHELGHILGLDHVNQRNTCPGGYFECPGSDCMMSSTGSRYSTTWSNCSIKKMKQLLSQPEVSGMGCLFTRDVVPKERSIMQSFATRRDLSVLATVFSAATTFIASVR